jgi:putative transposase
MRAYRYRIYPTPKQSKILNTTLFNCFRLYNTALQQRRDIYISSKKSVSYNQQQNELPELKEYYPEYTEIYSQVLQDVLHRVDYAYQSFFRRLKAKDGKAGFPRFKSLDRYDSFCFPQSGFAIVNNRIKLSKIGLIKIKLHRQIPADCAIKTCTIKREGEHWYCILAVTTPVIQKEKVTVTNAVGIDLGLTDFAVLSTGEQIHNPKYLKQSEAKLKEIQSHYSKGKSKTVKRKLVNLHHKIANQRKDFHHKLSHNLVNTFDLIAYEDLKVKNMIENNEYNLQKYISDAAWGKFIFMLKYKAEDAGIYCIGINPRGTTQRCSRCDAIVPKTLFERTHKCTNCGFETSRDYNAALNIHKLGISLVKEGFA